MAGRRPGQGENMSKQILRIAMMTAVLAGASSIIALRDLVPASLYRAGMELEWANRYGLMMHLFNLIIFHS